ncbi:hypothetical protein [Hyphomicrobium sp.]|uniref:hypothetical protein n=1 Tax=Hyphomicrobium sp. TaxID=82 RepID=UPI000FA88761|nr:hypothetical protein [Hyphomicrobium sp.]RUP00117.1 MAG: hypothetical protein EKK30_03105 [Hyphomicrobium sp.]
MSIVFKDGDKFTFHVRNLQGGLTSDAFERGCNATIYFPANKREFQITKDPSHSFYRLVWDKGKLPDELSGCWTSVPEVGKSIAAYFERLEFDKANPDQEVNVSLGGVKGRARKGSVDATGLPKGNSDE